MGKYLNIVMMILVSIGGCGMGGGNCPKFLAGRKVGTVEPAQISGASGIAASRKNAGVLWVHNDHGPANVYALTVGGKLLGTYTLGGVNITDWEDIAIGPGSEPNVDYLYAGDIGDNRSTRKRGIAVYRVAEPKAVPLSDANQKPANVTLTGVEKIELVYPDGPRDAETLMLDPLTKDLYIVTKEGRSRVYRAAYPQSVSEKTTLEYVAKLSWGMATGGDISPDGQMIIVRGYFGASLWMRPKEGPLWGAFAGPECNVPIIPESQGEAIGFDANGTGYYTTSENRRQPIYYFEKKQ
ncbi:MAG: PE-PGRS family protein [Sedimentisphaerales bacterium]